MKETKEEVKEVKEIPQEETSWNEVEKKSEGDGKFFKPEIDRMYKLRIKSAKPIKSTRFKNADGTPKVRVILAITSINGEPSDQTWETGSWTVIGTVKPLAVAGLLDKCEFLLRRKEEGDRTTYIFEEINGVKTPSSSFHTNPDEMAAYF